MDFRCTLSGAVAETAIANLLHHAGYPVVRSSIESIFPQLQQLSRSEYGELEISPMLRQLPDLMVLPSDGAAQLVEIKYRSSLTREAVNLLFEKIRRQQELHPQTHTVIIRGRAPNGGRARADDHVRVLAPNRAEILAAADLFFHSCPTGSREEQERMEPMWRALRTLPSVFPRLQPHRDQLERLTPIFQTLASL